MAKWYSTKWSTFTFFEPEIRMSASMRASIDLPVAVAVAVDARHHRIKCLLFANRRR